jgi:hypothetical protein
MFFLNAIRLPLIVNKICKGLLFIIKVAKLVNSFKKGNSIAFLL